MRAVLCRNIFVPCSASSEEGSGPAPARSDSDGVERNSDEADPASEHGKQIPL